MTLHALSLALAGALLVLPTNGQAQAAPRKPYIVQLTEAPAASYTGGVSGYRATQPGAGSRLDVTARHVQDYLRFLNRRTDAVAATVPTARLLHRYGVALNGFSALLTDAEVSKLRANPGVRYIEEDKTEPLDTSMTTSQFLGLSLPGGAWSRFDAQGRALRGDDVIVGVIDSGIWPEHPSFSDRVDAAGRPVPANEAGGTLAYQPLPAARWGGICQAGEGFPAASCNNKLIGARFFDATWRSAGNAFLPLEFVSSPRDSNGHGTHVASTAAGNAESQTIIGGASFILSGVAPRARVAAYKACWSVNTPNGPSGSCTVGDRVAAINQAVADGVDVINHSIGLEGTTVSGAVSVALLNATRAGVFVAASAGNEGPGNKVNSAAPWITTVANTTHNRTFEADLLLGNGVSVRGASWQTRGVADAPIVLAFNAGAVPFDQLTTDADRVARARCYNAADRANPAMRVGGVAPSAAAAIDPQRVAGRIVVCLRGGNTFVNKIDAVAGAAGVVFQNVGTTGLYGPSANTTFANVYPMPAVHLPAATEAAVLGYAAQVDARATMLPRVERTNAIAPVMSNSSSRGPNLFDLDVLKPDIAGPGTDIVAAHVPEGFDARMRDAIVAGGIVPIGSNMISGTSMASPHVAGSAALLRQANPGWSPAAIKSALMTSAADSVRLANGQADPARFGYGSGQLTPNAALSTSLVYDVTAQQFIDYGDKKLAGRDLNLASITHADVVGAATLTRTLSNRGGSAVTLTPTASLPGFTVQVTPAQLTIPAGGSASYTVRLARTTAALGQWTFGDLVWTGNGQTVRSPLSARPMSLVALTAFTDTRAAGARVMSVATGYDGAFFVQPVGLVPATRTTSRANLSQRVCRDVQVPAGAALLRAQMFASEVQGGAETDFDLTVRNAAGTLVGASEGGDSNELVILENPAAGVYSVCALLYGPRTMPSAEFVLNTWVVDPANNNGTLRSAGPARVSTGGIASVAASWNVPADNRYVGLIRYSATAGGTSIGSTQLFVDPLTARQPLQAVAPLVSDKTQR